MDQIQKNQSSVLGTNAPMLIDGELVASESGKWMDSINPANEELLGRVPLGTKKDMDRAVAAAEKAQPAWAALPVSKRAEYLHKLSDGLAARAEEILQVEVMDTGNTIYKMRDDVSKAIEQLKYFAGLGYEVKGQTVPSSPGNLHITVREPYGVVGRIIPFNHPISFAASRMAAPLIAGNTMVEKPSDQSPLSAAILAEIAQKVLPKGVVNIVTGTGAEAGDALVRHPKVKRVAFIGSVKTGMAIQKSAAEVCVKNVSLELGGKNPMIVFPDVNVAKAARGCMMGMNLPRSMGQSCQSNSRVFVHEKIYDKFLEELLKCLANLKVGDPTKEDTDMGALAYKGHFQRVMAYIESGKQEGAKLAFGGGRPQGYNKGYFVQPTVFTDVDNDMKIAKEEIFGPVISVFKWSDWDDVVKRANSVPYGLTGNIWTNDISLAYRTAKAVQSGLVWINGSGGRVSGSPFGGYKESGMGKEGDLSDLLSYTQEKCVQANLQF